MSNAQVLDIKLRNKINEILSNQEPYMKGFINFMSDSSTRTKYNYLNIIIRFMKDKDINELSFDSFNNHLEEIGYKKDGKKKTSSFYITTYAAMKKFSEYLFVSKKIPENYMNNIKRPKRIESQETIDKREKGYLTKSEIKKLLDNIDNCSGRRQTLPCWKARDKAMIYMFLNTGIRCSALIAITMDDIDFENHTLTVTEKGSKVRTYYLSDLLCDVIKEWIEYRKDLLNGSDTNVLFISDRRDMMIAQTAHSIIKKYSRCITDKNITPHKLRATYGTQLLRETGDIYFVQQCMGHANINTTELYIRGDKYKNTKRASDIMSKLM